MKCIVTTFFEVRIGIKLIRFLTLKYELCRYAIFVLYTMVYYFFLLKLTNQNQYLSIFMLARPFVHIKLAIQPILNSRFRRLPAFLMLVRRFACRFGIGSVRAALFGSEHGSG